MIVESFAAVFADFARSTTLRKKDDSATVETKGLYDEAETDYSTEHASVRSKQPQVTVPASISTAFGEGDLLDHDGKTYEILDSISDNGFNVFTLSNYTA